MDDAGRMRPSGFFAFRVPALPMSVLTEWAEGVEAPHAGPADLAGALERDRARLRDRLHAVGRRPEVQGALSIASPDLLDAVGSRPGDAGVEAALVRYVVRMASRATPFGLFAACGRGRLGDRTDIRLPHPRSWGRFTQLDADYLDALVRQRATALGDRLTLVPNDSLHLMAGRWRYVESRLDGLDRTHHLVQVTASAHLQRALDAARAGATRRQMVDAVAAGGVDEARAAGFTDRLVAAQVLVPTLTVAITGPPPLDALVADLEALGDDDVAGVLHQVGKELAAVDAEGPAASPTRHEAIAAALRELPAPVDRARLLHVDATVPASDATLARTAVDEIARGVDLLRRIAPTPPASDLDRFRDAFVERYETEEVPLLDALDEELGIGFGGDADPAPLLEGLRPAPAPAGERAAMGGGSAACSSSCTGPGRRRRRRSSSPRTTWPPSRATTPFPSRRRWRRRRCWPGRSAVAASCSPAPADPQVPGCSAGSATPIRCSNERFVTTSGPRRRWTPTPSTPRSSTCRRAGWSTCWPDRRCATTRSPGWAVREWRPTACCPPTTSWCRSATAVSCSAPAGWIVGSSPA